MKYLKLLIFLILPAGQLFAQYSARNNDTKLEADYYLMSGDYQRALKLYLNVLKSEPGNSDMKYKAGICYLNSENEKATAIEFLEAAAQSASKKYNANSFKEMNAPIEAHFLLGSAYRVADRLDDAIKSYNNYKNLLEPRDEYNHAIADQYIKSCITAKEMQQNPVNLDFTNLGELVNTSVSNFNPVISGDGKILAYTAIGTRGFEIYYSRMTEGAWGKPVNITTMLGSAGRYLKTTGMTFDGTQLFFVYSDPFDSEIYTSKYSRNRWSRAEKLDKPINGKSNEIHCSISADSKTLYFVSDRSGGEGDFDIYKSTLNSKGEWGKPVNLGTSVNTLFKEDTPFVSPDGKYLYFSSEGHTGMGGLDVFRVDLSNPGSEPVNLGYPINNTDNNTFFFPYGETNTGYYAAKNKDSYGNADIYLVNLLPGDLPIYAEKESITDSSIVIPPAAGTSVFIFTPVQEDYTLAESEVLAYDESTGIMLGAVEPFRYDQPGIALNESNVSSVTPYEPIQPDISAAMAVPEFKPLQETFSEPVSEPPLPQVAEIKTITEAASVTAPAETTPDMGDRPADVTDDNPVSALSGTSSLTATAYTIQIGAGKKPLDMKAFNDLDTVMVTFGKDEWYRYTCGIARDIKGAELLKDKMIARGYKDAFIVSKPVISQYTIQVMAVPGPIVSALNFQGLPFVTVVKGQDMYLRYSTGEFASIEEASAALDKIRGMGFRDAFVRKVW